MSSYISITKGKYTLVDDEDYAELSNIKWQYNKGYVYTFKQIDGKRKMIQLHRLLTKAKPEQEVDHINGDGLDNRKTNLRLVTRQQNCRNRTLNKNSKSGYKGVSWHKHNKKWSAYICVNKKITHLGYFIDKTEAAKAYNEAAIKLHGEFAKLNKI